MDDLAFGSPDDVIEVDPEQMASFRAILTDHKALTAEMEFLRDIIRGVRSLDDVYIASPLDIHLGQKPLQPPPEPSPDPFDIEEAEEGVAENQIDDPLLTLPVDEDNTVCRQLRHKGRTLKVILDDSGWVEVVPNHDVMALPLLTGHFRETCLDIADCRVEAGHSASLVSAVEVLLQKTLGARKGSS